MQAAIYFPLFVVLVAPNGDYSIFYLSADLQEAEMFKPRKPLSEKARRAGWQGFLYDMQTVEGRAVGCASLAPTYLQASSNRFATFVR